MIDNVVLVSGVQQGDSVICIHVSILFQILFPFRVLQSTEQSSLCYTGGPCWLSVLNIAACTCQSQMDLFTKQKQTHRLRGELMVTREEGLWGGQG